jgi:hypothetical protein
MLNVAAKKVGLFCSLACTSCQGQSCSNVESPLGENAYDIGEDANDISEKTSDSSLLEQFTCIQQEDEEEEEKEEGKEEDSTLEVPSDNYQSDE